MTSSVSPCGVNQEGADPMELDQQIPTMKAVGGLRLNQRLKRSPYDGGGDAMNRELRDAQRKRDSAQPQEMSQPPLIQVLLFASDNLLSDQRHLL